MFVHEHALYTDEHDRVPVFLTVAVNYSKLIAAFINIDGWGLLID